MIFGELIKEKIENFKLKLDMNDIFVIFFIFITSIFLYNISKLSKNYGTLIVILLISIILLKVDYNMQKNENFTNIKTNHQNIYSELNTGDLIYYRCYTNDCIGHLVFMKFILPLVQQNSYFTHIGMIYKADNGKLYILESNGEPFFCSHQNKLIDKGIAMIDFNDRIDQSNRHRIHIIKTNIYKYINTDKLKKSIEKYKNYDIDQINCIEYVTRLLYDTDILKLPTGLLNRYLFDDLLNKSNYNIDVQFEKPIIIKNY